MAATDVLSLAYILVPLLLKPHIGMLGVSLSNA